MADLVLTLRWNDENEEAAIVQRKQILKAITGKPGEDLKLLDFLADCKFETDKLYREAVAQRDRKRAGPPANDGLTTSV